jgi:hypothetical protein
VRIETGSIKVESTVFSHPEISLRLIGARIADLPIDASLPDVLALSAQFRPEEIEDSGLLRKVLAAQEEASRLIDRAAAILEPLGIERAALSVRNRGNRTACARWKVAQSPVPIGTLDIWSGRELRI